MLWQASLSILTDKWNEAEMTNELYNVMHMSPKHALAVGSQVYMEQMVYMKSYQHCMVTSTEYSKHDKRMIHNEIVVCCNILHA